MPPLHCSRNLFASTLGINEGYPLDVSSRQKTYWKVILRAIAFICKRVDKKGWISLFALVRESN